MPAIDVTMKSMTSGLAYLLAQSSTKLYMYIEYGNVETPEAELAVPTVDASEGIEYYIDLEASECCDFLRVPILSKQLTLVDSSQYSDPEQLALFASDNGQLEGNHGRPFTPTAISKIIGGALVLVRDEADYTQDLVLQRWYYAEPDHIVKTIQPIGIRRTIKIGV